MKARLTKIDGIKSSSKGDYYWLYFLMETGKENKTFVYTSNPNYERMWKHIIRIGIGVELKNLSIRGDGLIDPNSDMIVVPFDETSKGRQEQLFKTKTINY